MAKMGTLKSTRFIKLCSNLVENALKLILRPSTKLKFQPSQFIVASLQMQDTGQTSHDQKQGFGYLCLS